MQECGTGSVPVGNLVFLQLLQVWAEDSSGLSVTHSCSGPANSWQQLLLLLQSDFSYQVRAVVSKPSEYSSADEKELYQSVYIPFSLHICSQLVILIDRIISSGREAD